MGTELLQHQLDRELREEHDISFSEYEILVRLSEADGGRMRMATLADAMSHSRSRVTHTISRMEKADLVVREASRLRRSRGRGGDDGRGPARPRRGRADPRARRTRAPGRPRLDRADFAALGRIFDEVSDRLLKGKPEDADIR